MEHAIWFGWAGGALLVARIAPQTWRIWRTGSRAGVSRSGVWCWLGNDIGWFTYGVTSGLAPLWASSVALIVLDLVLLTQLGAHRHLRRSDAVGISWAAAMTVIAASGSALLAPALIAASVAGTVPHAIASVRASDLSGISPTTWRLAALDGVLWLVYGAAVADGPVTLYAALTLVCSATILHQLARKPSPHNPTTAPTHTATLEVPRVDGHRV
jgi:uncharacterized protein with PQ loop repeat